MNWCVKFFGESVMWIERKRDESEIISYLCVCLCCCFVLCVFVNNVNCANLDSLSIVLYD